MILTLLSYETAEKIIVWSSIINKRFNPTITRTGHKEFDIDIYVGF